MANIIFVTSKYLPLPDANGLCVAQIIKQLQREGHNIICICTDEGTQLKYELSEEVEIFRVSKPFYAAHLEKHRASGKYNILLRLFTFVRLIRSFLILPMFPNTEPYRARKIYRIIESIVKDKPIHCIIGVFRPFEGVAVALKIKRKHPEIICAGYYLDIMKGAIVSKLVPRKMYYKLCDTQEIKIFKHLDFILMAEAGRKIYETSYFNRVENKISYINFPVFRNISIEVNQKIEFDKEYYNIVYAGYLDKSYRNPAFLFSIVELLCKKGHKIKMHIYGRNNCMEIINKYCQKYPGNYYYYGIVNSDTAKSAIVSADAVLNISNRTDSIVPSKVFELFSSCKPIINVITNPNDDSLQYFLLYPSVCIINEYKGNIETAAEQLMEFLATSKDVDISYNEIEPLYYTSTPIATTSIINNYINKESDTNK